MYCIIIIIIIIIIMCVCVFVCSGEWLNEVIHYLQDAPLLLGDAQLRMLLEKWPDVLCSISSKVNEWLVGVACYSTSLTMGSRNYR